VGITNGYIGNKIATYWKKIGNSITPRFPGDNIDIDTGGLKDNDVTTTPVELGEPGNTSFNTSHKSIIGAVNELDNAISSYYIASSSGGAGSSYGQLIGVIDGNNKVFQVPNGSYQQGTLWPVRNGKMESQGSDKDWEETSPSTGIFTMNAAPLVGDELTVHYNVAIPGVPVIADDEISTSKVWSSSRINNEFIAKVPLLEKVVNSVNDLPAPSGGVIVLENRNYIFNGFILIPYAIAPPSAGTVTLSASIPGFSGILYTGGATFFQGTMSAGSFFAFNFGFIIAAAAGGTLFDIDGDPTAQIYGTEFIVTNLYPGVLTTFDSLGTIKDVALTFNNSTINYVGGGITFDNCRFVGWQKVVHTTWQNNANTIALRFISTNPSIKTLLNIEANYHQDLGTNERFISMEGNVFGSVYNNFVTPPERFYTDISKKQDNIDLRVFNNYAIKDSTATIQIYLENNTAITYNPAKNAWVFIAYNVSYTYETDERFELLSDGGAKYLGLEGISPVLAANVLMKPTLAEKILSSSFCVLKCNTYEVTFDNTTNIVIQSAHGLNNGDIITFKISEGTLPAELRKDLAYYVVNATTNNFQVSYILGGAAITFTDNGTPVNSYCLLIITGGTDASFISSQRAISVSPKAIAQVETNDVIYLLVRNESGAQANIEVLDIYYSVRK